MKKFIVLIISVILSVSVYSQEHLKFMGIPIDGKVSTFMKQLKAKGFKVPYRDDSTNKRTMNGSFFGRDVVLFIYYNPQTKIVSSVAVTFQHLTFESAKMLQENLTNIVKEKYHGLLLQDDEERLIDYVYELSEEGKTTFFGTISVFHGLVLGDYVVYLVYEDEINSAYKDNHKNDI